MRNPDVIIIGGGQAGLAMSRSLSLRDVEHVVLERGRVGERWHSERWHSLKLLTTSSMSSLPGLRHSGDPDFFIPATAFASYLGQYAHATKTPIITDAEVTGVEGTGSGFRVTTTVGQWRVRAVIIATGACDTPYRPPIARALPKSVTQIFAATYREPAQLPEGGVLVVGASASGAQLAEEIHASGRAVTLAAGNHTRAPRRYRGRDIYEWMETAGILDEAAVEGAKLAGARRQPSLQVVGRADNRDLNLDVLSRQGIRLTGRLAALDGERATFGGDLQATVECSHARMLRMLDRIDQCIDAHGYDAPAADPTARAPFAPARGPLTLDLKKDGVRSVVWATGYVRRYPWLKLPVLDEQGELVHRGGVTAAPGLYAMGLNFMRRRRSAFINGCALDAEDLAPIVRVHLDRQSQMVA